MYTFSLKMLRESLEQIEHSYFCYEKECGICDGINYKIIKQYGKFEDMEIDINKLADKQTIVKFPNIGEIFPLKTSSPVPIYVIILKTSYIFSDVCRLTIFPQFKTDSDIIYKSWMIQPHNKFKIFNMRLSHRVDSVESSVVQKILDYKDQGEQYLDIIYHLYRDTEIEAQNRFFLDNDDILLQKIVNEKYSIIDSVLEYIKNIGSLVLYPVSLLTMPSFADTGEYVHFGINESEILFENNYFRMSYVFYYVADEEYIKLFINHFIGVPFDLYSITLNGENINFNIVDNSCDLFSIEVINAKGSYQLTIGVFDRDISVYFDVK